MGGGASRRGDSQTPLQCAYCVLANPWAHLIPFDINWHFPSRVEVGWCDTSCVFFWPERQTIRRIVLKLCIIMWHYFRNFWCKQLVGSCQVTELWRHKKNNLQPNFSDHAFPNLGFKQVTSVCFTYWIYPYLTRAPLGGGGAIHCPLSFFFRHIS